MVGYVTYDLVRKQIMNRESSTYIQPDLGRRNIIADELLDYVQILAVLV